MAHSEPLGVHLITGGFPPGSLAGHDMDYVRLTLLGLLAEHDNVRTSVANDYHDVATWLPVSQLLVTYAAGPYPANEQNTVVREWVEAGGRWLALHGTTGGRAERMTEEMADGTSRPRRAMMRLDHHDTLGGFFLNHPPLRRFTVDVTTGHPITDGLPSSFATSDELYLVELTARDDTTVLLTTDLPKDPSPDRFGFWYGEDSSLFEDGRTRALGYVRELGAGAVTYLALGHTHTVANNTQPFVDESVTPDGTTPSTFRGSWQTDEFRQLLRNSIVWGLDRTPAAVG